MDERPESSESQRSGEHPRSVNDLRRIIKLLDNPAKSCAQLALLLTAQALDPVLSAFSLMFLLDGLGSGDATYFWRGAWVFLAVMIFGALIGGIGVRLRVSLVETLARRQREALVESVVDMPLLVFEKAARGDLASRLTSDIAVSSRALTECYLLARAAIRAIAAGAYMLALNWQVALACALTGPFTLFVSGLISRPINQRSIEMQKAIGEVSSVALNTLEGVAVVKSFCAEGSAERRFAAKGSAVQRAGIKMGEVFALNATWMGTGSILPFIVAFGYGGYMALQGRLTVGGIMALVNLCNNLGWPLAGMGQSLADFRKSLGAFRRVTEVLDGPRDVDPAVIRDVDPDRGRCAGSEVAGEATQEATASSVTVSNLDFEYVPGNPVLKDISMEVPPGSLVVLAGKSGCGKSTLIKILAGLYRPAPGVVFIEGHDLHYEAVNWAREATAYVPQEPFLFSGTVRENLGLANADAGQAEHQEALSIADALEFVGRIQGGLDCDVSERGGSLSGGERQRLCIARTLLKGGSVLLVDEPTSSVDRQSEERIWASLLKAMQGRTCIVATHRLDIARRADLILVMDGGQIVESGTHETLFRPGSTYSSLVGEMGGVAQ